MEALQEHSKKGGKTMKNMLADLLGGKLQEDPFPSEMIEEVRKKLTAELTKLYPDMPVEKLAEDREQPIQVRLLGGYLRACGDPDWRGMAQYAQGIRYGIAEKLPRTPAVFPQEEVASGGAEREQG